MHRIVFVNPPNHQFDAHECAPPLGLMNLGRVALEEGFEIRVIDLSLPQYREAVALPAKFYGTAVKEILAFDPTVVALTSMCVNTHVAILLAERIKRENSDVITIVGGVHLSSIHDRVSRHFPWIDALVAGEGELAFREFLGNVKANRAASIRSSRLRIYRSPKVVKPSHPHEIYAHVGLGDYFAANSRRVLNYEGGRGCAFECAFCYSPSFYNAFRDVEVDRIVRDWEKLAETGAKHVFMVHDNFVNSPAHAVAVCDALAVAKLPLNWNCYATLSQLSPRVIDGLARSRCVGVFIGVDAVSKHQQTVFNKRFYRNNEQLLRTLTACVRAGVLPTCAFIVDLYQYDSSDLEAVLCTATACALAGAAIRINAFTRYPGSALGAKPVSDPRPSDAKVRILLDCPEVVCSNPLASQHASAFPFHATEVSEKEWVHRLRMIHLAQNVIQHHPEIVREITEHRSVSASAFFDRLTAELPPLDELDKREWKRYQRVQFLARYSSILSTPSTNARVAPTYSGVLA